MANSLDHKPESFSDLLKLVAQTRETLSLQATNEGTKIAVDLVNAALESGLLESAPAGTAAVTPFDTGLAPSKALVIGPQAQATTSDPGMVPVPEHLANKVAVPYDEDTQDDMKAKQAKADKKHK